MWVFFWSLLTLCVLRHRDFLPRGSGIVTRRPLVLQLINSPTGEPAAMATALSSVSPGLLGDDASKCWSVPVSLQQESLTIQNSRIKYRETDQQSWKWMHALAFNFNYRLFIINISKDIDTEDKFCINSYV